MGHGTETEIVEVASAIRGSNQSGMRAHNERLVLSLLRQNGPMAKAGIARATGLSAQTVSVMMRRLEAEGFLEKGEPVRGKVGQPSVPMRLAAEGAYFLGLKIGRRSSVLVLTDFLGRPVERRSRSHLAPEPAATIRFARESIAEVTAALPADRRDRLAGLGIAMPFRLWDWTGPGDLAPWRDIDIAAELGEATGLPVFLQNDATAACGAEMVFGTNDTPADFFYFYIGYFAGGGLVLGGTLFPGRSGNAAALGSMPVPDGAGGTRQLIEIASLSVLDAMLSREGLASESLWRADAAWTVDRGVLARWIEAAGKGLAHAIAAAVCVIDADAVLIDGWMPDDVRSALVAATSRSAAAMDFAGVEMPAILPGSIGPEARAIGAASLPLMHRFLIRQPQPSGTDQASAASIAG